MRGPSEERAQAPDGATRGVEKQGKRTVAREQMHTPETGTSEKHAHRQNRVRREERGRRKG
jgi:hypothetical protein